MGGAAAQGAARNAMNEVSTSALNVQAQAVVKGVLATLQPLNEELQHVYEVLTATQQDANAAYTRLDEASARFSTGTFADYYTKDLSPARGELFYGIEGVVNEAYCSLNPAIIDDLRKQFIVPAQELVDPIADRARRVLIATGPKVVILARLEGFEHTLQRIASILQPPWDVIAQARVGPVPRVFPGWVGRTASGLIPKAPIHERLFSIRRAKMEALRLFRDKAHELTACLETTDVELPFARVRETPAPIPSTLIVTFVGDSATITNSAVGTGAQASND
jgi:hypothetical protein